MSDDRYVIVIGSGPSGASAAQALLRARIPVVMLESGRNMPSGLLVRVAGRNVFRRRPPLDGEKRHVATGDPEACWYQAAAPGGLSNFWTGATPRFAPDDFVEGERLHERYRWPLSYADLAPYYASAERQLRVVADTSDIPGLPAPENVVQRRRLPEEWNRIGVKALEHGHGLTPLPLADGPRWLAVREGVAFNSYSRMVNPLRRNPHFKLVLGAHVLRLEWDGQRRRVSGVTYRDRVTGADMHLRAAAIVIAGGPVSSTKLLLDSACSDFPSGLGNDEGVLGKFLHDHPQQWCVVDLDRSLPRLGHAAYLTRGAVERSTPLLAASCTLGSTSGRDRLLSLAPTRSRQFGVLVFGTMIPTEQNYVALHPTQKDEFGLPKVDLHVRYDAVARDTLYAARAELAEILDEAGYQARLPREIPDPVPGSSVHYGGTVRMHASPRYGMLDGWNRLHAIKNVVVADASAFTTGVEKNPTLTAMALAARAAERLAVDLKAS